MEDDILYTAFAQDDVIKIGGPEEINPKKDVYPHNYAKSTYSHSRKERLDDIIFDYISDEDTPAEQFYSELKTSVKDCVDYFEKYRSRSQHILNLIQKDNITRF